MAFVFCDDRWKKNKQNKQPGPGQYSIQTPITNDKDTNQPRPFTSLKKKRNEISTTKPEENAVGFKQWLSSGIFKRDIDFMSDEPDNSKTKKGKLHRNITCIMKKCQDLVAEQQRQRDFKINNQKENTWGNKKIVELLSDHKRKESKTELTKKACSSSSLIKNNLYSYQVRQKLQNDLKELQSLFPAAKRNESLKHGLKNREKSAKHKSKQPYNHSPPKTEIKSQLASIQQHFEVCASNVYKSPRKQKEQGAHKLPATTKHLKVKSKDENLPTGCSDYLFEDSVEYIDDNTPGPGSYSFNSSAISIKPKSKVQKFGITMERFKQEKKVLQPQIPVNPIYPDFKATSQANQEIVGFGSATKQPKQQKPVHNGVFYEDCNNLQNKAKKVSEKSQKQRIVFGSCKQRFVVKEQKKNIEQQSQSEDNEEQIDEKEVEKKIKIPTNIFLSKVKREFPVNTCTEDVDYSGQNYNCLANKLKKQKEFYEDYEIQVPPFNIKEERFKQIQEEDKRNDKEVQLKIQKVEQPKKRKQKSKTKQCKGFKFPKELRQNSQQRQKEQSPSPNKYLNSPKWIKSTYNIRFT